MLKYVPEEHEKRAKYSLRVTTSGGGRHRSVSWFHDFLQKDGLKSFMKVSHAFEFSFIIVLGGSRKYETYLCSH